MEVHQIEVAANKYESSIKMLLNQVTSPEMVVVVMLCGNNGQFAKPHDEPPIFADLAIEIKKWKRDIIDWAKQLEEECKNASIQFMKGFCAVISGKELTELLENTSAIEDENLKTAIEAYKIAIANDHHQK